MKRSRRNSIFRRLKRWLPKREDLASWLPRQNDIRRLTPDRNSLREFVPNQENLSRLVPGREFLLQIKSDPKLLLSIRPSRNTFLGILLFLGILALYLVKPGYFDLITSTNGMLAYQYNLITQVFPVMGLILVMLIGGMDFSLGATFLTGGVVASLAANSGMPLATAVGLGMLSGALVGLLNGALIILFKLNPLLVTLSTMAGLRSLLFFAAGGKPVENLPAMLTSLGGSRTGDILNSVLLVLGIILVIELLMRTYRPLRQSFLVGSNEIAARMHGLPVNQIKWIMYILAGVLAALAGILNTARAGSAALGLSQTFEIRLLFTALLAGASLRGGRGSLFTGLLSTVLVTFVFTLMDFARFSGIQQDIFMSGLFIMILIWNRWTE